MEYTGGMADERKLSGKVAIVTGSSSGIGRAIAERLGGLGAEVYLSGRNDAALAASKARIEAAGGAAHADVLDVRDTEALAAYISDAAAASGGLHIMVNNAGLGHPGGIVDGDPEQWREMFDVNVLALAVGCQAAVRAMRETGSEGHIVNISSTAALNRDSGMYGATKYAVNCINSSLRSELQDDPIRAVSIMPGVFGTNFVRNFDRELVETVAAAAGLTDVEIDAEGRLDDASIEQVQRAMSPVMGDVARIADAVEYVVTQPIDIHVEEIVLRPPKQLEF